MMTPKPHQTEGAAFLARRSVGLLADAPRVGKTGAAIMATDLVFAESILVITTASGRGVWARGFEDWSVSPRSVGIVAARVPDTNVVIVGWPSLAKADVRAKLLGRAWDVLIVDEDHYAKNYEAKRTQAVFGTPLDGGDILTTATALFAKAERVWTLSGTPLPHSPADTYPRLRALEPSRLKADPARSWPDVTRYQDFLHRYCVVRMKAISRFNKIPVVIGGRNEGELKARMAGFMLRRTQADIGMLPPVFETMPLIVSEAQRRAADGDLNRKLILDAAERGATKDLDMHLGPLRRFTGGIKAAAVADAIDEEFECGLDKVVLMYWHRDVGDLLAERLRRHGIARLDGSTKPTERDAASAAFRDDPKVRVFLGQIVAAGEAIDLSAAAELIFVETSFSPKDMGQAAMRITNQNQERSCRVRVATLAGSIDEALQASLMRLWTAINGVMN